MGGVSIGEMAHRLAPLVDTLMPVEQEERLMQLGGVLTRDGKVRLDKTTGFLDPKAIPTQEQESGVVVTIDFASIAANSSATSAQTVPGARALDGVVIGLPAGFPAGLIVTGLVSADDTVTIRIFNVTGGAIDPASFEYRIALVR